MSDELKSHNKAGYSGHDAMRQKAEALMRHEMGGAMHERPSRSAESQHKPRMYKKGGPVHHKLNDGQTNEHFPKRDKDYPHYNEGSYGKEGVGKGRTPHKEGGATKKAGGGMMDGMGAKMQARFPRLANVGQRLRSGMPGLKAGFQAMRAARNAAPAPAPAPQEMPMQAKGGRTKKAMGASVAANHIKDKFGMKRADGGHAPMVGERPSRKPVHHNYESGRQMPGEHQVPRSKVAKCSGGSMKRGGK